MITSSPGFQRVTPSPTFQTIPEASEPPMWWSNSGWELNTDTGWPSAAQTLLKFTPAAITRTVTSKAPGSGVPISSIWKASLGSPSRSWRMTQAAIVGGSSPGSTSSLETSEVSTAKKGLPYGRNSGAQHPNVSFASGPPTTFVGPMEASEKPQLTLDDASVRALGDRLVIEHLTVTDERAARVVRDRAEAGQRPADTVSKAVEIGARVLDSEETAVNVDYVQAEFERHAGALRRDLSKSLEAGDEQLAERIAASFDPARDGSVPKEIEERVKQALVDQRESLLKLFSAEEGANPLFDFKDAMVKVYRELGSRQHQEGEENRKMIGELRRELLELKERTVAEERVAEAEEAGTRKGRGFEGRVHEAI